jgi:hypothetical protein
VLIACAKPAASSNQTGILKLACANYRTTFAKSRLFLGGGNRSFCRQLDETPGKRIAGCGKLWNANHLSSRAAFVEFVVTLWEPVVISGTDQEIQIMLQQEESNAGVVQSA